VVIIEVLSPSSEGDDDGDKRLDFQSLSSLEAYVLAYQDQRCVKIYRRDDRGDWSRHPDVALDGQSFLLPRLTGPITVADVYREILDSDGRSLIA
jgi:Uma2 family endonuclease